MSTDFAISFANWEGPIHGPPEIAATSARLQLEFGSSIATRSDDDWAKSTRNDVLLSAYPMALWFASSWWRLRWEPPPEQERDPSLDWRMAHELPAAGFGFLWPGITFASDGERFEVTGRATEASASEPIRYITNFRAPVPAQSFETTIDRFVETVLARLDAVRCPNSDLGSIWKAVLADRGDPELAFRRQLEARLGYDPDDAPEDLLKNLIEHAADAGGDAINEIASGIAARDPLEAIGNVLRLAKSAGVEGRIETPGQDVAALTKQSARQGLPWERGRVLARSLRSATGWNGQPITSKVLSDILHIPPQALDDYRGLSDPKVPLGLTVRRGESEALVFLFRRRNRQGRRFEASRFLADWLSRHDEDRWFPATDASTARQKFQRAFAAEFLCPIDALQDFLGDDFSEDRIEDASEYFDLSTLAIRSHLANHRLISRDSLA